jgi:hypothetical protein
LVARMKQGGEGDLLSTILSDIIKPGQRCV